VEHNIICIDRAIGQFWKQLALIIPVNGDHVEHSIRVFNVRIILTAKQ